MIEYDYTNEHMCHYVIQISVSHYPTVSGKVVPFFFFFSLNEVFLSFIFMSKKTLRHNTYHYVYLEKICDKSLLCQVQMKIK